MPNQRKQEQLGCYVNPIEYKLTEKKQPVISSKVKQIGRQANQYTPHVMIITPSFCQVSDVTDIRVERRIEFVRFYLSNHLGQNRGLESEGP